MLGEEEEDFHLVEQVEMAVVVMEKVIVPGMQRMERQIQAEVAGVFQVLGQTQARMAAPAL